MRGFTHTLEFCGYNDNWAIRKILNLSYADYLELVEVNKGEILGEVATWERTRFNTKCECQKFKEKLEALLIMNRIVGEE